MANKENAEGEKKRKEISSHMSPVGSKVVFWDSVLCGAPTFFWLGYFLLNNLSTSRSSRSKQRRVPTGPGRRSFPVQEAVAEAAAGQTGWVRGGYHFVFYATEVVS